jgi:Tfp pilus assembly protein PilF
MPRVNPSGQVNRNDPCPCGSGKKYKKCCMGRAGAGQPVPAPPKSPPSHRGLLRSAMEHARAGRLQQAEGLYRQALEGKPNDAEALFGLGVISGRLNRPEEGIDLLRRAIAADGKRPDYHAVLADLLLMVGRLEEAESSVQQALKLDPDSEAAHRMAADCHHRMRRFDEAMAHVTRALAINPESRPAELFLAVLEREKGELNEARNRLEGLVRKESEPQFLARALKELGLVLDRLSEHDLAFQMLERSGREMARTPEARALDRDLRLRQIETRKAGITKALLCKWERGSFQDAHPTPAFLVGFPRSGTTLTEQILAAHPDIASAEEKPLIAAVQREMTSWFAQDSVPAILNQLDADDITKLRAVYWQQAEAVMQMSLTDKVFVDKLPLNILEIDLINVLFPEARLIVLVRDPRDVCVSCFMQRFVLNAAMVNFLWWERTAEFYSKAMDLWLHVRDMTTLEFIEVKYEDTVSDLQGQARRILDFLGVAWDEGVLSFHEHARRRFIATPSASAVSEPIYRRAMGRWHNYAAQMDRVSDRLQPFIEAFGYG